MEPWIRHIRDAIGNAPLIVPSAAVWIEDEAGRVLLQKRSATTELWGLLGGNMGWGESAEETAIRETREEAGIGIAVTGLIGIYSKYVRTLENGHLCQSVTTLFRARIVSGRLTSDGHETFDLRYFDPYAPPPLMAQHAQMLEDARTGRTGFYR